MTSTSLACEQEEQKRWKPLPKAADMPAFDILLSREFRSRADHDLELNRAIRSLVQYVNQHVPYYRTLFADHKVRPELIETVEGLTNIPPLSKTTLKAQAEFLKSRQLPSGERIGQPTASSGTTGEKTVVHHTVRSRAMFGLLKQRELRWFRFDPVGSCAWIRMGTSIPPNASGKHIQFGETFVFPSWPVIGKMFHTGPTPATTENNSIDWLADWMQEQQPVNMIASTATLEHLAFTLQDQPGVVNLKRAQALATHVSAKTEARIEGILGATTHQNYGLNEIGIVAAKCREGGRYHVHTEHCLVEIVDEDGVACEPGEMGRLLVTSLTNLAMPLIRYDSGDQAVASDGGCTCGRSLPTFERIVGRTERMAPLPEGTLTVANAVFDALEGLPKELSSGLQKYQLHQNISGDLELRLVVSSGPVAEFEPHIRGAFNAARGDYRGQISFQEVEFCPLIPSNKYAYFTSEHVSPEDGHWPKRPEEF